MRILIYGMGSMGKLFYDFFYSRGYDVGCYDLDESKRNVEDTKGFDVVFLCVPMWEVAKVVENLDPSSLIVDISSVKRFALPLLEGFDVLSIHPMFGGDSEIGLSNIIVVKRSGRREEDVILEEFRRAGAKLSYLSPEEHDDLMARIQGIAHFTLIAMSDFLRFRSSDLIYASPIFSVLHKLASRILNQNWEMYYHIQRNSEKVREEFLRHVAKLHEELRDRKRFEELFGQLREIYDDYDSSTLILEAWKAARKVETLEELRGYIRAVDALIKRLIELRVEAAKKIAMIKAERNEPIEIKELEEEKLREILSKTRLNPLRLRRVFEEIMKIAKEEEYEILGIRRRVAVLGPQGSFSEEAALRLLKSRVPIVYCSSIEEIVKAVESGEIDYGIVPIENSVNGTVLPTLDALMTHDVEVFGETELEVSHCLAAKRRIELRKIRRVYSHPQAIAQCMGFINNYLPQAEIRYTSSTSDAATLLDDYSAAIMSENAARLHGLQILRRNIQDLKDRNVTRFYVIRRRGGERKGSVTAIFFGVEDRPGALKDVLEVFYRKGINLRKLESRPARTYLGDYVFFTEVEAALSEEDLEELRSVTTFYKVVGVFDRIEEIF
ncbi:MAG: prephenate dehydratase [Archaeoglobaceae archaeon]